MNRYGHTPLSLAAKKLGTTGHHLRELLIADKSLHRDNATGLLLPTARAHGLVMPLYGSVTTGCNTKQTCKLVVSRQGYRYCESLLAREQAAKQQDHAA